jgi:hypothetical protein
MSYDPTKIVFTLKSLSVDVINITGGTQSRLKIKEDYVEEIFEKARAIIRRDSAYKKERRTDR